jgi:hypothetical protein
LPTFITLGHQRIYPSILKPPFLTAGFIASFSVCAKRDCDIKRRKINIDLFIVMNAMAPGKTIAE